MKAPDRATRRRSRQRFSAAARMVKKGWWCGAPTTIDLLAKGRISEVSGRQREDCIQYFAISSSQRCLPGGAELIPLWRAEQEVWNWESVRDDLTNGKLRENKWRRFRFTKASPLKMHCGDLSARFCRKRSSRKLRNIPFI